MDKPLFMIKFTLLTLLALFVLGCSEKQPKELTNPEALKIRQVHDDYVNGWLQADEEKVMGLLAEGAMIQPNKMTPIEGKPEIRKFWFPNDSSKTTINEFQTKIISLNVFDTLAVATHTSLLDWTYEKDTVTFGMIQKGINTTVYIKQVDSSWKIWRSMWTDIKVEAK